MSSNTVTFPTNSKLKRKICSLSPSQSASRVCLTDYQREKRRRAVHRKYDQRRKRTLRHLIDQLKECIHQCSSYLFESNMSCQAMENPQKLSVYDVICKTSKSIRRLLDMRSQLIQQVHQMESLESNSNEINDSVHSEGICLSDIDSLLHSISEFGSRYKNELVVVRSFQERMPFSICLDSLADYFSSFGVTGMDGRIIFYKPANNTTWKSLAACDERLGRCSRMNHLHSMIAIIAKNFGDGRDEQSNEINEDPIGRKSESHNSASAISESGIRQMVYNSFASASESSNLLWSSNPSSSSTSDSFHHPLRQFSLPYSSFRVLCHALQFLTSLSPQEYERELSLLSPFIPAYSPSLCPSCVGSQMRKCERWNGEKGTVDEIVLEKEKFWHRMFLPTYDEIRMFHQLYNERKPVVTIRRGRTPTSDYNIAFFDTDVMMITDDTGFPLAHIFRPVKIYFDAQSKITCSSQSSEGMAPAAIPSWPPS